MMDFPRFEYDIDNSSFPVNMTIIPMETNGSYVGDPIKDSTGCPERVRFYINTLLAGTICVLGFTGNALTFAVLSKDKEAPTASFLLKSLAFIDNFFLCNWMLHFSISNLFAHLRIQHTFHITWLYIRVYTYPLLFMGQTATIWMVVLIAVSRFIAVCVPYRAVQYTTLPKVQRAVVGVVVFSVLYNIPRYFETTILKMETNGTYVYTLERTKFGNMLIYGILYFDSLYIIFTFVLPLIILIFLNTKLTLVYNKIKVRRNSLSTRRNEHHDQNITLVMIVVILVFMLCNAPARVVQIIWGYQPQQCLTTEFLLMEISNVLEVLNSSANFIVYCVFRSQFRQILKNTFCAGRTVSRHTVANNSLSMNNINNGSLKDAQQIKNSIGYTELP